MTKFTDENIKSTKDIIALFKKRQVIELEYAKALGLLLSLRLIEGRLAATSKATVPENKRISPQISLDEDDFKYGLCLAFL